MKFVLFAYNNCEVLFDTFVLCMFVEEKDLAMVKSTCVNSFIVFLFSQVYLMAEKVCKALMDSFMDLSVLVYGGEGVLGCNISKPKPRRRGLGGAR